MKVFSPEEFASLLRKVAFGFPVALHEGLKGAVKVVEKTAKDEIGHYQKSVGEFPAWAPLTESTLEQKEKLGYSPPDNPLLRTGELRDSISSKVEGLVGAVGSTSDIMPYHEFGTSKMAMRPVLGPAVFKNKKRITKLVGVAAISGFYGGGKKIHESLGYEFKTDELDK